MAMEYREFLFQTLYMLVNKPTEEYDTLFDKIKSLYSLYLISDLSNDYSRSEYDVMSEFIKTHKEK